MPLSNEIFVIECKRPDKDWFVYPGDAVCNSLPEVEKQISEISAIHDELEFRHTKFMQCC